MKGTEKQVAWAEKIKAKMIERKEKYMALTEWGQIKRKLNVETVEEAVAAIVSMTGAPADGARTEAEKYYTEYQALQAEIDEINNIDDAVWFINNRHLAQFI